MPISNRKIIERADKLKSDRSVWETHWSECAQYILPNKDQIIYERTPGEKRNNHLFDNTAIHAAEILAGSLHSFLTNPDRIWFELTTGVEAFDKDDEVRFYLQDTVARMIRVMNNSNFQTEVHEYYMDLVVFGTANLTIEEDDKDVVRFLSKPIGECIINENALGIVDEVYRIYKWPAHKILDEWRKQLPDEMVRKMERDSNDKWEIIHAVMPSRMAGMDGGQAYFSRYILREKEMTLEEKGFNEFPYIVSRWSKISGEMYGRSPGMTALPEAKTVNKMVETTLKAAEMAIIPPLQLPDDGFLMPIVTKPGGLNFYRAGSQDKIEPLFTGARVDFGEQLIESHRQRIRQAFYVDQLILREGPQKTATEVMQIAEEQNRFLGPLVGRQSNEFLRPMIDRVFNIMERRELLPEPPASLEGRKVDVKYNSLIAQSQRISEGQNILRTIGALEPFITLDPTVADNLNGDMAAKKIANIYNFPQEILRTQEDIAAIRQGRQEAQEQMAQQQEQAAQADTSSKMISAVAKTR